MGLGFRVEVGVGVGVRVGVGVGFSISMVRTTSRPLFATSHSMPAASRIHLV